METPIPSPAPTHTLRIEGMSCGHCVRAVREALEPVDGVAVDDVTVGEATIRLDATAASWGDVEPRIRQALAEAGYALA
ncbi:MAG: heavy-metal-associated domain-containing protein [Bacteroidetes bacterium]|nr:heavy-metal-associated domain-containing protein [Bacteroidota bacterium]